MRLCPPPHPEPDQRSVSKDVVQNKARLARPVLRLSRVAEAQHEGMSGGRRKLRQSPYDRLAFFVPFPLPTC